MRQAHINIHSEHLIRRWNNGIRLIKPGLIHQPSSSTHTVNDIMNMPMNFYFMDTNSIMQKTNEMTAKTCGYLSSEDAVGKSVRDVSKNKTAEHIIKNDREIISNQSFNIIQEDYTRLDDIDLTAISFKFPWFEEDKIIGIFGCSILIGHTEAASSLKNCFSMLLRCGLLSNKQHTTLTDAIPCLHIDDVFLNERDTEILYFLVRGNTAKNIAKRLGLSHRTIEHRLDKIRNKLSVSSRNELIEKVIDHLIQHKTDGI